MTRETAYRSQDFTDVEPILIRPSGGSDPNAAVAWEELQSAIATRLTPQDLESALATLFEEVLLTAGVTDTRAGTDGTDYFFTRFTITVAGWQTNKLNEVALIERETGIQRNYSHLFQVTGPGTFFVEFESKRANPVLPDDAFLLRVQRLPEPGIVDLPAYLNEAATLMGINLFRQVYAGTDGNGVARFKNGNVTNEADWIPMGFPEKAALAGLRFNEALNAYEVV